MAFTTQQIPDITNGLGGTGDPGLQLKGVLYIPDRNTFPEPWNCVVGTVASGFRNGDIGLLANLFGSTGSGPYLAERGFLCLAFQVRLLTPIRTQTTSGKWHQQTDDFKIGVRFMRSDPGGFGFRVTGWVGGVGGSGSAHHCIYCCVDGTAGDDKLDAGIPMSPVTDMGDPAFTGSEFTIVSTYGNSINPTILTNESPISLALASAKPIRHYNGDNEAMPLSQQARFSAAILAAGVTNYVAITNTGQLGRVHSYAQWPDIGAAATTWLIAQTGTPPPPPPQDTTPPIFSFATVPSSGTEVDVNLVETGSPPCLPVSGVTGFTVKVNGVTNIITAAAFTNATTAVLITTDPIYSIDVVTVEYDALAGNVKDSASPANFMATFAPQNVTNGSTRSRAPIPIGGGLILTVPLQPGTLLSNVRYVWIANGVEGLEQTAGVSQPIAGIPEFRFNVTPPTAAEEMIAYDVTDPDNNWNPAQFALHQAGIVPAPNIQNQPAFLYPSRLVTFQSVWEWILRRLGQDPSGDKVRQDAMQSILSHINDRVADAWVMWPWPQLEVLEERPFRTTWTADFQFRIGDELYYPVNGNYYDVKPNPVGDPPVGTLPTNTIYFDPLSLADKFIAFDQPGKIPIGDVVKVYPTNPRLSTSSYITPLNFQVSTKGIDVLGYWPNWYGGQLPGNTVWVLYRVVPSEFTVKPYIPSRIYNFGDLVLSPATGQCYKALLNSMVGVDPSNVGSWALVPFPAIFAPYVQFGAFADSLSEQDEWKPGPADDSRISRAEARAEAAIQTEIDRLIIQGQKHYWSPGSLAAPWPVTYPS